MKDLEEAPLKDLEEEVITALGSVYGDIVIKKVLDLLRDSTPFQMAVTVLPYPFSASLLLFFFIFRGSGGYTELPLLALEAS